MRAVSGSPRQSPRQGGGTTSKTRVFPGVRAGDPLSALQPTGAEPRINEPLWLQHQTTTRDFATAETPPPCGVPPRHIHALSMFTTVRIGHSRRYRQDDVAVIHSCAIERLTHPSYGFLKIGRAH